MLRNLGEHLRQYDSDIPETGVKLVWHHLWMALLGMHAKDYSNLIEFYLMTSLFFTLFVV